MKSMVCKDNSQGEACCCTIDQINAMPQSRESKPVAGRYFFGIAALLTARWLIYSHLEPFAGFFTHTLSRWMGVAPEGHLGSAIAFFVFETPKVLMLLTLVVFGVGIVRSFFTPERIRAILAGKRESVGNVPAAMLGILMVGYIFNSVM